MTSSTSVSLSQALLARAISHHGSNSTSDRVSLSTTFTLPSFASLKSTSSSSSPSSSRLSLRRLSANRLVRATVVETLDKTTQTSLVEKSVNTIRFLVIDVVEKANLGHPGLPMECALMGHILYDESMRYNPKNPYRFNRDQFVFSVGHGCMLQYALLHLAG